MRIKQPPPVEGALNIRKSGVEKHLDEVENLT